MLKILDEQTENGSSTASQVAAFSRRLPTDTSARPGLAGQDFTVICAGVFGGAEVAIEIGPTSSGPWVQVPEGEFSEPGALVTPLSRRAFIRATVSGATGTTNISAWVG